MKLGLLVVLAVAVLVPSLSESRIVSKCELKEKLRTAISLPSNLERFREEILALVVCNVNRRSSLNTALVRVFGKRRTTTTTTTITTTTPAPTTTTPEPTTTTIAPTTTATPEPTPEPTTTPEPTPEPTTTTPESTPEPPTTTPESTPEPPTTTPEPTPEPTTTTPEPTPEPPTTPEPTTTIAPTTTTPEPTTTIALTTTTPEPTTTIAPTTTTTTATTTSPAPNTTTPGSRRRREAKSMSEEDDSNELDRSLEKMLSNKDRRTNADDQDEDDESDEGDEERKPSDSWSLGYYGIFQLFDSLFCDSGYRSSRNVCRTSCTAFTDDNIMDDIACFVRSGYWRSFVKYNSQCNRFTFQRYFAECK